MTLTPRTDRDRYVAFAFAAADLLLELDSDYKIQFAAGASQNLLGRSVGDLEGVTFSEIIDPADRRYVARLLTALADKGRHEPASIRLKHASGRQPRVMLGGCRLGVSAKSNYYLTLTMVHGGLAHDRDDRDGKSQLLTRDALLARAQEISNEGGDSGVMPELSLLNLSGLSELNQALPPERSDALMEEVSAVLRSESIGGDGAGRIGDESFGILHSAGTVDIKRLQSEIEKVANGAAIAQKIDVTIKSTVASLDLNTSSLDERDAARALAFAMATFAESHGENFTLTSLSDGFAQLVDNTVGRVAHFRELVSGGSLSIAYQPIVTLSNRKIHHYEALARMPGGGSPYEMVVFGEQVGLAEELDISICARVIEALKLSPSGTRIAVNLSGRSLQNSRFLGNLEALLDKQLPRSSTGLLMFEVTESNAISDLEKAANFLQELRLRGHPVCLDDFGAGAAGYNYLRRMTVDYVKIDGPFLKSAVMGEKRERALIRGIASTCVELRCHTIGEMIENEGGAKIAVELGLELGQGWLFGKAGPLPQV